MFLGCQELLGKFHFVDNGKSHFITTDKGGHICCLSWIDHLFLLAQLRANKLHLIFSLPLPVSPPLALRPTFPSSGPASNCQRKDGVGTSATKC